MKKFILTMMLVLSAQSFSSKVVSKDRTFWDKVSIKPNLEAKIMNRFDYESDLAVISSEKNTEEEAIEDAREGIRDLIQQVSKNIMLGLLERSFLEGPGFNTETMDIFSIQIADILYKKVKIEGIWLNEKTNTYSALLVISYEDVRIASNKIFVERLGQVIEALKTLKEGIKVD